MFSTFNSLVRAIQEGQAEPANNSDTEEEPSTSSGDDNGKQAPRDPPSNAEDTSDATAAPMLTSFFDLANTVVSTVQARTNELVTSVKETDWASEIEAFKKELQEDTQQVVHTVEHSLEHLPEHAANKDLQGTLLQVQAQITDIGRSLYVGTTDLIHQVNDAIQEELHPHNNPVVRPIGKVASSSRLGGGASNMRYSRFEAEVSAMQRDSSTYCDEPEDEEEFGSWMASFDLDAKKPDIDELIASNAFMAELQSRIVPLIVEYDDFWTRYFYRLHKLQAKHQQRAQVVQRAMQQEEETVAWDDEPSSGGAEHSGGSPGGGIGGGDDVGDGRDGDDAGASSSGREEEEETGSVVFKGGDVDGEEEEEEGLRAGVGEEHDAAAHAPTVEATADTSPTAGDAQRHAEYHAEYHAQHHAQHHADAAEGKESASGGEESPKAATGSDGSVDPWCVVTSPSKKQGTGEQPFGAAQEDVPAVQPKSKEEDGLSVSDIDLSTSVADGGEEDDDDFDEDWGLD